MNKGLLVIEKKKNRVILCKKYYKIEIMEEEYRSVRYLNDDELLKFKISSNLWNFMKNERCYVKDCGENWTPPGFFPIKKFHKWEWYVPGQYIDFVLDQLKNFYGYYSITENQEDYYFVLEGA